MIFGKLKLYAIAAVGFVALLAAAILKGRSMERVKNDRKVLKEYQDTRKDMDDAPAISDPDLAREWLRNRGKP